MSSNIQRRRSIEPGLAFAWPSPDKTSAPSPPSSRDPHAERRACSHHHQQPHQPASPAAAAAAADSSYDERAATAAAGAGAGVGGPLSSLNLKGDYVVPPMSSVSVDPPIPAETDSRSAQDQHPMRANLPLLSQPLLSTEAFHYAAPAAHHHHHHHHHQRLQHALPPTPGHGHATCTSSSCLIPRNHHHYLEGASSISTSASSSSSLTPTTAPPSSSSSPPSSSSSPSSATTPTTIPDSGGPTFLTLPPEIRRMIYQHIPHLTNRQPLIYCLSIFKNRKQHPLAAICRLVRAEALDVYYSSNTWLVKLEYRDFYDSFASWILGLDDASANALRLLRVSVRGAMFAKEWIYGPDGFLVRNEEKGRYGYATYAVDLSEKWAGGRVEVLACDGPTAAGLEGKVALEGVVRGLWEKKGRGQLKGSDVKEAMDTFLSYTGWWL